ncbi:MAG TPA: VWA domain-containing protein [Polyangia bacterium]
MSLVVRAAVAALGMAAACSEPTVISPERAAGGSLGGGGPRGAGGSSGAVISLPDAAPASSDTAGPACLEEAYKAEAVPVDLMLLVDASGSMSSRAGAGTATKWALAQNALASFVSDARSAGLGVGMQFFPESAQAKPCTSDADCGMGPNTACVTTGTCVHPTGIMLGTCYQGSVTFGQCPTTSMCVPAGVCSATGLRCQTIGQPCPQVGGGMCMPIPKRCASGVLLPGANSECELTNYEKAAVPIASLPANEAALTQALRAKTPSGGTPMRSAVEGALKQLRTHLEMNPGRKAALVLASDGLPSCTPAAMHGIPAIAELVNMARMGTPSVSTYVVGVFSAAEIATAGPQLDSVAMAGGTGQAFVLTASDDLAKSLQDALNTIRGSALSCEFKVPPGKGDGIDFGKVNVRFTPTSGAREDLPYVRTKAGCDPVRGGWHYDVDPANGGKPTSIHVCPASCEKFKQDGSAKVDLVFGCVTG